MAANKNDAESIAAGLFAIAAAIDKLSDAVTKIAHGDVSGPAGLEAVAMAINGTLDPNR